MKQATKIKRGMAFNNAFYSLPKRELTPLTDKICERTGWSSTTFYNKLNGRTRFRIPEVDVIENIFKEYNIDAWTGDYITAKQSVSN